MKRFITSITTAVMMTSSVAALPASAEVNDCPLKTPQIVSTANTDDSVTLRWTKVSKATGYKVYKKVGSKYKLVGTVRDGAKVKYKITKLKDGKKYTFKVRAFRKSGGKTCFSKYSKEKSVTTKELWEFDDGIQLSFKFDHDEWINDFAYPEAPGEASICTLVLRRNPHFCMDIYYWPDYTDSQTAKQIAQEYVDMYEANPQYGMHAELAGKTKIAGLTGYTVRFWNDDDHQEIFQTFCLNGQDLLEITKGYDFDAEDVFTAQADKVLGSLKVKKKAR